MYVLDTNTVSYFFRGQGQVAQRLLGTAPREIAIPSIVLYEIEAGIAKSPQNKSRRRQLSIFVAQVLVIPFAEAEARSSALIRSQLEKKGQTIGPYDILIGGTALANSAILATHNTREFGRIKGLKIEDWY